MWVLVGREGRATDEGLTLTAAEVMRAGGVTQPLVVTLWTLRPAVTQVRQVNTHWGGTAAVVSWTGVPIEACEVFK